MSNCYKDTEVLKNKFNLKDTLLLHAAERRCAAARLIELQGNPEFVKKYDFNDLKKIHNYIFQDVYAWAGKQRTEDIQKMDPLELIHEKTNKLQFCECNRIEGLAEDISKNIKKANYLKDLDLDSFAEKTADIFGELNYLHPFREGNGRTQREFIRRIADNAGWHLDFTNVSKELMTDASIAANHGDISLLKDIIKTNIQSKAIIQSKEYQDVLEKIACAEDTKKLRRTATKQDVFYSFAKPFLAEKNIWTSCNDKAVAIAMVQSGKSKDFIQKSLTYSPSYQGLSQIDKLIKSKTIINEISKNPQIKKQLSSGLER